MSKESGEYEVVVEGSFGDELSLRIYDPTSRSTIALLDLPAKLVMDLLRGRCRSDAPTGTLRWFGLDNYGKIHERKDIYLDLDDVRSQAALDAAIAAKNLALEQEVDDTFVPFKISPEKYNHHRWSGWGYRVTAWRYVDPPHQMTVDDYDEDGEPNGASLMGGKS